MNATKHPNHLAAHHERLQAAHRLPKAWQSYFEHQTKLNDAWLVAVGDLLSADVASLCQVVRFCDGQLIVSTPNQTLVNHLRYLSGNLIDTLGKQSIFADIHSIHVICLGNPVKSD